MTEDFLFYIWRSRLFDNNNLTSNGKQLSVIHPGTLNSDSGPDFFNARIRVGDTLWAGNIEIHVRASDWFVHGHQGDDAYNNIVLHVVYENDTDIFRKNGEIIPCLEMKGRIDERLFRNYLDISANLNSIPCERYLPEVRQITVKSWLHRVVVERLESRSSVFLDNVNASGSNWEQSFFERVAYGFGLKVNAQPMLMMARNTPVTLLAKHRSHLFQLEAILFGQAGLLTRKVSGDYPQKMRKEYDFLATKYQLKPLQGYIWKYARMRPAGFPDLRLSQLARLLYRSVNLFSYFLSSETLEDLQLLYDLHASEYWNTHFRIGKPSEYGVKRFGKLAADNLLINAVIPFLLLYGKERNEPRFVEKALAWLEQIAPEDNAVVRRWRNGGVHPVSALETQALLHLKKNYCDNRRCLDCAIGSEIISSGG